MNKKGIEVAVGTIVMIILAVLSFIFALAILFQIFGGAEEIKTQIDVQTQSQIEAAMQRTNEIISIPLNIKQVKAGKEAVFGMGVKNIYPSKKFSASLSFDGAYYPDGSKITNIYPDLIEEKWLGNFKTISSFTLEKNDYELIPLTIVASPDIESALEKGDYVFNVCVFDKEEPEECTISNKANVYTNKIYQVVVRVI